MEELSVFHEQHRELAYSRLFCPADLTGKHGAKDDFPVDARNSRQCVKVGKASFDAVPPAGDINRWPLTAGAVH